MPTTGRVNILPKHPCGFSSYKNNNAARSEVSCTAVHTAAVYEAEAEARPCLFFNRRVKLQMQGKYRMCNEYVIAVASCF